MTHDEYRQRLYDAAEAFYFAGLLTSLPFNAANNSGHNDVSSAANAVVSGKSKPNSLGAPPIVNFGFSIELYIKLLWHLADATCKKGHDLHELFLGLDKVAPRVGSHVMCKHRYARGDRDEFLCSLKAEAKVFKEWRYAYEEEFLCSSPDTLFIFANAFRSVILDLHPDMTSAFANSGLGTSE